MTLRAETLTAYPDAMLQLLPARNLIVNVETVVLARSLVEAIPESVARENRILLMGILEDRSYLFAAVEPIEQRVSDQLEFILNRRAVFVGMSEAGVSDCLDRNYGASDTESVVSVLYYWLPTDGLRNGPAEWAGSPALAFGNTLIFNAFIYVAHTLAFETDGTRLAVWHLHDDGRRDHQYSPTSEIVSQLVPLLRSHLRNPITTPGGTLGGEITVEWWGRAQTLTVWIADRPTGHRVLISIPPDALNQPIAPNPAASARVPTA